MLPLRAVLTPLTLTYNSRFYLFWGYLPPSFRCQHDFVADSQSKFINKTFVAKKLIPSVVPMLSPLCAVCFSCAC